MISLTKTYRRWSSNCLQFYLSMYSAYPSEMGSLEVLLYDDTTMKTQRIFTQNGVATSRPSEWKEIKVDINIPKEDSYWVMYKLFYHSYTCLCIYVFTIVCIFRK